ncbi:tyrosine-type recombinase/integrase [Psychrobacter sp. Sarcosine-3u-12]|uniref:tyrosine-type recombinase/integrase n=1 Tax=Psychrobacter sp. Sarcosine-3u-12 TaxID=2058325 RepID=UPI000C339063|nr:tyrosine-type recombinase/integrase [Psychrobacter sp. Sarcosine-3u-12]PKG34146.1 integrase [Psychrobacter sp. Sarcosine-3u-12]
MKVRLTKKFIDSIDYTAKGTDIYMDDVLTGFALRVGKQSKRYTLHKRINGKLYRDEVEETHLITLTEAREKASIMMANIKKGMHVYDGLHENLEEPKNKTNSVPTLKEAYDYFKSTKTGLAEGTITTYDRQILNKLKDWLNISLNDITKSMISDKHKEISKHSEAQANATMRALRSVWNYCRDSFLDDDEDFLIKEQPIRILNAKKDWNRVKPRTKHIEEEYLGTYLKTLLNYVDRSSHMQAPHSNNARDIMLLFMFTGVRLNEAQSLKWSDIDLKAGRIIFKDTKNGSDYHMPTSNILQALLEERWRISSGKQWVFPSDLQASDNHIKDLSGSYRAIGNQANLYITPHDLRRTFGTVANSLNISYPVLKRLLNHREAKSSDDVTLQYIQVSQRQLRDALNSIESFYCQHACLTQAEIISKYY